MEEEVGDEEGVVGKMEGDVVDEQEEEGVKIEY